MQNVYLCKKRYALIVFILLILIGSFINFYASNLLCADIGNSFYGLIDHLAISTFPLLLIAVDFVVGIIFFARIFRHKDQAKPLFRLYSIIFMVLSFVGIIMSILTPTIVYHSWTKPYPFNGYAALCLVVHCIFLLVAIFGLVVSFKLKQNGPKHRISKGYVLYNIFIGLFIYFVLNRTGALMWTFSFAQERTLYLTIPFYITLAFPLATLVLFSLSIFNLFKSRQRLAIVSSTVILVLNVVFTTAYMVTAYFNTEFISAVSPCMPISRLASMPVDAILSFLIITILPLFNVIYLLRVKKNRELKKNKNNQ